MSEEEKERERQRQKYAEETLIRIFGSKPIKIKHLILLTVILSVIFIGLYFLIML